ncbi:MAG: hypothetical protein HZB16_00550 [Armatimonadetes bacterium]|nr:hypothetical protein [Armatimonadota bacterium]
MRRVATALSLMLLASAARAFSPAVTTGAGLRLEIPELPLWTALGEPRDVVVRLTSLVDEPTAGQVRLSLTDTFRVVGDAAKPFALAAKESSSLTFQVTAGEGTYRAHYPVHATATFQRGGQPESLHAVLVVVAEPPAKPVAAPAASVIKADLGPLALAGLTPTRLWVTRDGQPGAREVAGSPSGDAETKAEFAVRRSVDRGGSRAAIAVHPPWSGGKIGTVAGEWSIALPTVRPITFTAGVAIRDTAPTEPASDGITVRVKVADATLFERHVASKTWTDISVDLSAFASKTIPLRLEVDPGPKRDTTCDGGYLGAPTVFCGPLPPTESAAAKAARAGKALDAARVARIGRRQAGAWQLKSEAGTTGVAIVWGPVGLPDAQIALATARGELVIDGLEIEISGAPLAQRLVGGGSGIAPAGDGFTWTRTIRYAGRDAVVVATIRPRGGVALDLGLTLNGGRDERGHPGFTRIALGPGSEAARRVLFGHGNVVQDSPGFRQGYGGFGLSTRYVGTEYPSGLSLVQAVDVIPDALEHSAARRQTTLVSRHDTVFTLIPSERGAFAGARVWRGINGLKAAAGVAQIAGRMCLDQWGGDYAKTAADLELATRYGLDDAVFVKHVWQRWGYDYRLPDIYPPAGNRDDFDKMVTAAKANGRLLCLHDNYIDFYPDADGFTYDHVAFGEDGQPHRAWLNEGREAQSYRWLPTAYQPFLERNLALVAKENGPTSYFIDVFSAIAPYDGYDRSGRYFTRQTTARAWGETFDRVRQVLGGPTISEAGTDALIGHLDAAQADHIGIRTARADFSMSLPCADAERVPWFDMAHHRRFVQLAGGLGPRYAGGQPDKLHGYGSDDYLTLTALCGRTPMSDGPFGRRAVMTYYLLSDLCRALEHQEMLTHEFVDDRVDRQRVTFDEGTVTVNRGDADWTVDGKVLPNYGMVAKVGQQQVDISRRGGVITAMASSLGRLFVDARPPDSNRHAVAPSVTRVEDLGGRRYRLTMIWDVQEPQLASVRPFIHMCGELAQLPGATKNGDILWQTGAGQVTPQMLGAKGRYEVKLEGELPAALRPGPVAIRYGLYDPTDGGRLELDAPSSGDGRFDGGTLNITGEGPVAKVGWTAPAAREPERANTARRIIDFGPVATNLAFRLTKATDQMELTLLPYTQAGTVVLHLDKLGAVGKVVSVEQLDLDGQPVTTVAPRTAGRDVTFETAARAFRYRVKLAP